MASATRQELAAQLQYLKTENQILRSKLPERVTRTDRERKTLVRLGKRVGAALKELISIVSYPTFQRWAADAAKPKTKRESKQKPGRPRTDDDIRELILKMANDSGWGFTRIVSEIKRLGITNGKITVRNILKEAELHPQPDRRTNTWDKFLRCPRRDLLGMRFSEQEGLGARRAGRVFRAGVHQRGAPAGSGVAGISIGHRVNRVPRAAWGRLLRPYHRVAA